MVKERSGRVVQRLAGQDGPGARDTNARVLAWYRFRSAWAVWLFGWRLLRPPSSAQERQQQHNTHNDDAPLNYRGRVVVVRVVRCSLVARTHLSFQSKR